MAMFVAIQVVIWSNFFFYLLDVAFFIGLCQPRQKIWQPWLPGGHCFRSDIWDMASGAFNAVSDISILILPMPCLWKLQMPLKKKLVTIGIFATGFLWVVLWPTPLHYLEFYGSSPFNHLAFLYITNTFLFPQLRSWYCDTCSACVTSILRTYYTWKVVKNPDISYNIIVMGLWTLAEIATGIIVSCLPVFPKFVRHAGPQIYRAFSTSSQSAPSSNSAGAEKRLRPSLTSQLPLTKPSQAASKSKPWHHSNMQKAQNNGDYTELEEYNAMV